MRQKLPFLERSSGVTIAYLNDYITDCIAYEAKDNSAFSVNAPVSIIPVDYLNWPSLFDDILPVGKFRAWWLDFLNVSRQPEFIQIYTLLTHACTAPIYDFAPMKADPEMVTRLFKWERDCEQGGNVDFKKVAKALADRCDPDKLLGFLNLLANRMLDLPKQLEKLGCPEQIINFPAIGFHNTKNKLINMGVLDA